MLNHNDYTCSLYEIRRLATIILLLLLFHLSPTRLLNASLKNKNKSDQNSASYSLSRLNILAILI